MMTTVNTLKTVIPATLPKEHIFVALFISRNKDNKHLLGNGFRQRREAFITTRSEIELTKHFQEFVHNGIPGEMSRFYISINPRSNSKTQKQLIHEMIDNEIKMASIGTKATSIAMKPNNIASTKEAKWLFDFDIEDASFLSGDSINAFIKDIKYYHENTQTKKNKERPSINISQHKTPNGYAIIVDQRFDTRELLNKWQNVELKKDAMICYKWGNK